MDYKKFSPRENAEEIFCAVKNFKSRYGKIILVANSIGAFFAMNAGIDDFITKAYFISPIVDMEKLILNLMAQCNVTEDELKSKCVIPTDFGENLSWEYLSYVRANPITWNVPTQILYGEKDFITSFETIMEFAKKHQASVTVMEGGEHWFHTEEQMNFLDNWIKKF